MSVNEKKDTLKTTAAVGGGQIIIILAGILKTKIAALLLGPVGIGIIGILTMATDLIKGISSLGIPLSGVREVSIAESSGDPEKLSRSVEIFNKWILLTALLGGLFCVIAGFPLSQYLFGNYSYAVSIMCLGLAVFFMALTAGRLAVLQGKRAIPLIVKANLYGTIASVLATVFIYFLLKQKGIIPAMIVSAVLNFAVAVYFYRKAHIPTSKSISLKKSFPLAKEMIKIGLFTIVVVVFDNIMGLVLRSFITERANASTVGYFTAANTIAGMYLTVILSSLSSDYLPKLSALKSNEELNTAVNLQLQIVLLLASPFIIGMIGFSDVVIRLLYSKQFLAANLVLQWQILGDFFKIIAWPCAYIFLARGMGRFYAFYSIAYTTLYFLVIYLAWDYFGFEIVGFSFFLSQLVAAIFVYVFFHKQNGLRISPENQKIILVTGLLVALSYFIHHHLPEWPARVLNAAVLGLGSLFSAKRLNTDVGVLQKVKAKINTVWKRTT